MKSKIILLFFIISLLYTNYTYSNFSVYNHIIPPEVPQWKTYDNFQETLQCLTRNIFYESPRYRKDLEIEHETTKENILNEIKTEWLKVALVTKNRVESDKYPDNYCGVIYQKSQFSWTLEEWKVKNNISYIFEDDVIEIANYKEVKKFAKDFLTGKYQEDITNGAMFYHAHYVNPKWGFTKVASTRWHIYYK